MSLHRSAWIAALTLMLYVGLMVSQFQPRRGEIPPAGEAPPRAAQSPSPGFSADMPPDQALALLILLRSLAGNPPPAATAAPAADR